MFKIARRVQINFLQTARKGRSLEWNIAEATRRVKIGVQFRTGIDLTAVTNPTTRGLRVVQFWTPVLHFLEKVSKPIIWRLYK
jgi:hypothetical protein